MARVRDILICKAEIDSRGSKRAALTRREAIGRKVEVVDISAGVVTMLDVEDADPEHIIYRVREADLAASFE